MAVPWCHVLESLLFFSLLFPRVSGCVPRNFVDVVAVAMVSDSDGSSEVAFVLLSFRQG